MSLSPTFDPSPLRHLLRMALPAAALTFVGIAAARGYRWQATWRLAKLKRQLRRGGTGCTVRYRGYSIRVHDAPSVYVEAKDILERRIYYFEPTRPDPLILDCGANIGVSTIYFGRTYPSARIIAFEPDRSNLPYLRENLALNGVRAQVVEAAVAADTAPTALYSDGTTGSVLARHASSTAVAASTLQDVPCVRLREYLTERVDFLKMNIEGAEWEVLADCADRLSQVDQMVIEYHHLEGLPRTLHRILSLLHECGFEVLINDFDHLTNPAATPPFRLNAQTRYFLLIYAKNAARS